MSERPLTGGEIYDQLIAGEPRFRHAAKLDPETLALSSVLVGDGEAKQVFEIPLHKVPALWLLASREGWPDAPQIQRLATHWLAGQAGLEGHA